jgi:histidinol dehydrogenase
MKVIDLRAEQTSQWQSLLCRRYTPDEKLISQVSTILSGVRRQGDQALIEFARRFDHVDFTPEDLTVSETEIRSATDRVRPELFAALESAHANVRDFASRSLRLNWMWKNAQGAEVGERFDPLARVGIYVPAGTAPLVSTAIMTLSLAATAGVPEIVAVSPEAHRPSVHSLLAHRQFSRSARSSAQETPTSRKRNAKSSGMSRSIWYQVQAKLW